MGLLSSVNTMTGGLSNLGLSAVPGMGQYVGQQETNQANARQATRQMQFQAEMSNTAYQRAMADMKKAGLNPLLAYEQGGASTPSGAAAHMENPAIGVSDSIMNSAKTWSVEAPKIKADTELTKEQAGKVKEEKELVKAQKDLTSANARKTGAIATQEEVKKSGYTVVKPFVDKVVKWFKEKGATENSAKTSTFGEFLRKKLSK